MVIHAGGRGPGHIARSLGVGVFDYYVDPVSGNDSTGSGTLAAPYATVSKALTVIGSSTSKKIGLKRGTTLRNDPVSAGASGTYIGAYGFGAAPNFFGSSQIAVSSFTKVGNLYTLTGHTYNPLTLALVDGSGNATKLKMTAASGTNSAVDPAAEGEWTFFPGTHATPNILKFYTTATITGYQVEVPQSGASRTGIAFAADNCTLADLNVRYWTGSGTTVGGDNMLWSNCESSFNGGDGFDADQHSANFLAYRITATDNGQRWAGGGGPGDGFSGHSTSPNGASGLIIGSTFKRNMQTGVGNQSGTNINVFGCYFENNASDHYMYRVPDGLVGSADCDYCVFVHNVANGTDKWSNANGLDGSAEEAVHIRYRNCTIYYSGVTVTPAATFQNFTYEVTSCAAKFNGGVSYFGQIVAGTPLTSTNNISNGQTTAMWRTPTFILPDTETGALTTDPLFTNAASGDFTLQAGSPCIDAGTNWGQTQDYTGKAITGTPDRGAFER